MSKRRGPKCKIDYAAVVAYATENPTMYQVEIAIHFKTTQSVISRILRSHNIRSLYRGRPLKQKPNQTAEQFEWEKILQKHGLGMDRGLMLGGKRIFYGYDGKKEKPEDDSATLNKDL